MTLAKKHSLSKKMLTYDYVGDSLLSMYDAIENMKQGQQHVEHSSIWTDLCGNGSIDLYDDSEGGNDYYNIVHPNWPQTYEMPNVICSSLDTNCGFTVEAVLRTSLDDCIIIGTSSTFRPITLFGGRCSCMFQTTKSAYDIVAMPNSIVKGRRFYCCTRILGSTHVLFDSFSGQFSSGQYQSTVAYEPTKLRFGNFQPSSYDLNDVIHQISAVRVHRRFLSDDEVLHNYAVDKERFGI